MAAVSSSTYAPSAAVPPPAAAPAAAAPETAEPKAAHLIKKLSVDLLKTYNTINQRYYARRKAAPKQRKSPKEDVPGPYDDEHSDYKVRTGERLQDRYVVDCVIGKGSFGRVVKAYDERNSDYVAIKIVKSKRAFRKQAAIEIDILDTLRSGDPTDQYNIVKVKDFFMHHNHQCIVFELLSYNLYELLRDTKFHGVSLNLVRKFAKQLLHTLDYTSKLKGGIIHCDLKPENILLRNSRHSAIKVIDFGSACYSDKKMYTYIQSRFYRAPEVLLGCSYNCAIDMWSLGCILVEMHTGKPIFDGSNAQEQVTQHFEVLGYPPAHMLQTGRKAAEYFMQGSDGNWRIRKTPDPSRIAGSRRTLRYILGVDTHGPRGIRSGEKTGHTQRDYLRFEDLVARMLTYDPKLRITARDALAHPFFQIDDAPAAQPIAQASSSIAASPPAAMSSVPQSLPSPSAAQAAGGVPAYPYPVAANPQVAKAYPATGAPNSNKVIDLTRDEDDGRVKLSGATLAGGSAQSKPQAMLSPTSSNRPVAMDSDADPHSLRASRSDLKVAGGDTDTTMASADGLHAWNPGNYGLYGGGQKPAAALPQPQQSPLTRTRPAPAATGPLAMPGLGRSASDVPQQLYASQHMASGINYAT